jgi:MFS superfamily sulfate permease-like transporter/CRP-like cAMP-binding protein
MLAAPASLPPSALYRHILDEKCDENSNNKLEQPHHIPQQLNKPNSQQSFLSTQVTAILYGVINLILAAPCSVSYALIIFSSPLFKPYLPQLTKLLLWSSVIHQITFSMRSSLPFAIGQVQDAGLIFLSAMSSSIVLNVTGKAQYTDAEVIATTLVCLALSTAALGVVLILIGRFKLASIVSYLPLPVVGGYLAFIGFFCLQAGFSICTNVPISHFSDWLQFTNRKQILLALPGVLGGIIILLTSHNIRHYLALPIVMLSMPIIFYIILSLSGNDLEAARAYGWLGTDSVQSSPWSVFHLYDIRLVQWAVFPKQFITWMAMVFVVAFSSCLDIAAIELDVGESLNMNPELEVVGISNVASGLTGGFTGSYIFSQTIFSFRTKLNSRTVGWTVAILEFALFLLPYNILAYVPSFFFGSCLIFIGIDLMFEWLIYVGKKLLLREYCILLLTFLAINVFSIEAGMMLGVLIACVNFILSYASIRVANTLWAARSNVVRNVDSRALLEQRRGHIVALDLKGFIFFGSAIPIMNQVKKELKVWVRKSQEKQRKNSILGLFSIGSKEKEEGSEENQTQPTESVPLLSDNDHNKASNKANGERRSSKLSRSTSMGQFPNSHANYGATKLKSPLHKQGNRAQRLNNLTVDDELADRAIWQLKTLAGNIIDERGFDSNFHGFTTDYKTAKQADESALSRAAHLETRYLIINFSSVPGLDTSSARQCFMILKQYCERHAITIVFCGLQGDVEQLLAANGVLTRVESSLPAIDPYTGLPRIPAAVVVSDLDAALDFCETRLIKEAIFQHELLHAKRHGQQAPRYEQSNLSSAGDRPMKLRECRGGALHLLSGDVSVAEILKDYCKIGASSSASGSSSLLLPTIPSGLQPPKILQELSVVSPNSLPDDFQSIENYFEMRNYCDGQIIFKPGDVSDRVYVLLTGEVSLYLPVNEEELAITTVPINIDPAEAPTQPEDIIRELTSVKMLRLDSQSPYTPAGYNLSTAFLPNYKLLTRIRAGCLFGDLRFFLAERRQLLAVATSSCTVYWLSRQSLDELQSQRPHLAALFQSIIVKSMSLNISNSLLLNIH